MYAKIENNQIAEYPLSKIDITARFPLTSFPEDFANNLPEGYVCVLPSGKPAQDDLKVITEVTPVLTDEQWFQVWVESDRYTAEELVVKQAADLAMQWESLRDDRDEAITACDWVIQRHREQVELSATTSITNGQYMAWLDYRQQLRDFPSTVQDPASAVLPTPPGQLGITGA
jgi:hypothetical protein